MVVEHRYKVFYFPHTQVYHILPGGYSLGNHLKLGIVLISLYIISPILSSLRENNYDVFAYFT